MLFFDKKLRKKEHNLRFRWQGSPFSKREPGLSFINLKRYKLLLIALCIYMSTVKIQRVAQSACILPMHVKEGDKRGESERFYIVVSGRPRSEELKSSYLFRLIKWGLS